MQAIKRTTRLTAIQLTLVARLTLSTFPTEDVRPPLRAIPNVHHHTLTKTNTTRMLPTPGFPWARPHASFHSPLAWNTSPVSMPLVKLLVGKRLYATGGNSSGTRRIPIALTAESTHLPTATAQAPNAATAHTKAFPTG